MAWVGEGTLRIALSPRLEPLLLRKKGIPARSDAFCRFRFLLRTRGSPVRRILEIGTQPLSLL